MTAHAYTIVIASYLEGDLVSTIESHGPDLRVLYHPELLPVPRYPCDHNGVPRDLSPDDRARWREITAAADIMFDFDWLEPETLPARCPRLRWIQATSAGIGGFMARTGLDHGGIVATTAAGVHAIPLAEFALTGILHFVKGIPQLSNWQHERRWSRYATRQLAGLRAIVVGLGAVGGRTGATLAALGVRVWGLGRDGHSYQAPWMERLIRRAELDDALAEADILVLACPLTPQTEGMIGAAQFGRLKRGAILVNVARGQVADEAALTDALVRGHLGGACLDVFTHEPLPPDSPLWGLDNVIISPHSASTVSTENVALVELFVDNLDRYRSGQPLRNTYRPADGY